jgi:TPR repeat protein
MRTLIIFLFTLTLFASDESYLLGLKAYYDNNSSNDAQAITLLSEAAKQNNADAAFLLGVAYSEGNITEKDLKKALIWYERAANLGDKDAMLSVGWLYYKGEDVTKDLEKAKNWFQKAADLGDQEALQMAQFIEEMI